MDNKLQIQNNAIQAETLIAQAIDKNVPVETMEKLLAMRRELKAEWAKEEYFKAMAAFQSECPTIQKTKVVKNKDGSIRYKFAPIESIIDQVKDLLRKHGFSYSINQKNNGSITALCTVTHTAGHSEVSEFGVPIDKDAYMNEAQKVASASTFAKRYAFCNAFGILTGDEDDDANEVETKPVTHPVAKPTVTSVTTTASTQEEEPPMPTDDDVKVCSAHDEPIQMFRGQSKTKVNKDGTPKKYWWHSNKTTGQICFGSGYQD